MINNLNHLLLLRHLFCRKGSLLDYIFCLEEHWKVIREQHNLMTEGSYLFIWVEGGFRMKGKLLKILVEKSKDPVVLKGKCQKSICSMKNFWWDLTVSPLIYSLQHTRLSKSQHEPQRQHFLYNIKDCSVFRISFGPALQFTLKRI